MQKQIIFPKIVPRLFSSIIDFMLMTLLLMPISSFCSKMLFVNIFKEYLIHNAIKIADDKSISAIIYSEKFASHYVGSTEIIYYMVINTILPLAMISAYFICFWHYAGTTPGKYILAMKIVDESDMKTNPNMKQSIIRLVLSPIGFITIWFSLLSSKRQTLHDKISGTVLVKK